MALSDHEARAPRETLVRGYAWAFRMDGVSATYEMQWWLNDLLHFVVHRSPVTNHAQLSVLSKALL
jgi:hypothetical protein